MYSTRNTWQQTGFTRHSVDGKNANTLMTIIAIVKIEFEPELLDKG